jgi:hypothetical protein
MSDAHRSLRALVVEEKDPGRRETWQMSADLPARTPVDGGMVPSCPSPQVETAPVRELGGGDRKQTEQTRARA